MTTLDPDPASTAFIVLFVFNQFAVLLSAGLSRATQIVAMRKAQGKLFLFIYLTSRLKTYPPGLRCPAGVTPYIKHFSLLVAAISDRLLMPTLAFGLDSEEDSLARARPQQPAMGDAVDL
ncbi:hypothetical protein B0H13DRAFT_1879148 [Mycena leptocephala]|nr:hypothetical protein B0H13DRAFT_1879148 [Mycena leptocephala]